MDYGFQPSSPQFMIEGDVATLTLRVSTDNDNLEATMYGRVQENWDRLQEELRLEVTRQLGAKFEMRIATWRRGSVEIVLVVAAVGTVYVLVSRYKNFVESINLLVRHLKRVIERFFMGGGPFRFTVEGSWSPERGLDNAKMLPAAPAGWREWDVSRILLAYLILSHAALLIVFIWLIVSR